MPRKEYHKQCEVCGKSFIGGAANAKYCPDCKKDAYKKIHYARLKQWRAEHYKEYIERDRRYKAANKEKIRSYQCEYQRKWREKNPEYHREYQREWRNFVKGLGLIV